MVNIYLENCFNSTLNFGVKLSFQFARASTLKVKFIYFSEILEYNAKFLKVIKQAHSIEN